MSDLHSHIGQRVHTLRRHDNLSIRAFARRIGVTHSHVDRIERGQSAPSVDVLLRLARAFRVKVGFFFRGYGDE